MYHLQKELAKYRNYLVIAGSVTIQDLVVLVWQLHEHIPGPFLVLGT